MTIRNRLALLVSLIFVGILLLFSASIYLFYEADRKVEFSKRLKEQAATKVNMLLNVKIKPEVLQAIYRNTPSNLTHEEVAVFDTSFTLIYHDAADIDLIKETKKMLKEIKKKREIYFTHERHQAVGFTIVKDKKLYIVTAAAYDSYGYARLENLFYTLIVTFFVSVFFIVIAATFFAKQALKPVSDLVKQVDDITATRLDLRVKEGKGKDEIAELGITFNQMLERLEKSFEVQKQFVSNISHELRTPLSSIITELDLSLDKKRTIQEYQSAIQNALNDARKLAKVSNSLLDMAKASYDPSTINFKEIRMDEILLDAQQQVQKYTPTYAISIRFESDLEQDFITLKGNEYLLKTACANLMENACKFSDDHHCDVSIAFRMDKAAITFSDNGIGIPQEDLPHLFVPFYRGKNKSYAEGNGIGLSLAHRIITLHKGEIEVKSLEGTGSAFVVSLPTTITL